MMSSSKTGRVVAVVCKQDLTLVSKHKTGEHAWLTDRTLLDGCCLLMLVAPASFFCFFFEVCILPFFLTASIDQSFFLSNNFSYF
jgi:hypothetical protein